MRKRIFATALMAMMMVLMCFTTAFAADGDVVIISDEQTQWLEENIVAANESGVTGKESWIKNYLTINMDKAAKDNGAPVQIGTYNFGSKNGIIYLKEGKTLNDLSKKITQSQNNSKTVDGVTDITDGLNIVADTGGAAAMMQGFSPIISLVLGIIVTLITMGMTLFSAFDIAYIAFPVFREKCEQAKVDGGRSVHTKQSANGDTKLRFVTDDAQYAVRQGTIENGVSPWGIYFKKRVMSYILLAIILFILLTGNISLITNIAIKIVSGIMNVLGGLA